MAKRKVKKHDESAPDAEPEHKAGSYTLKRDHEGDFRRTIHYENGDSVVLVMSPGLHLDLSQEEVDGLEKEISSGFIVPSNTDDKGRQKVVRQESPEATATIARLEKRVEEQAAEIAALNSQLEEATRGDK